MAYESLAKIFTTLIAVFEALAAIFEALAPVYASLILQIIFPELRIRTENGKGALDGGQVGAGCRPGA